MANRQFSQDADGADRFPSGAASQTGFAPRRGQQFDITRTAPAALRHRPPTDEEYTQYLSNLMDIQGFAAGLDDMLTSCTGDGDPELLRDLIANYLAPLRAYQDEIVHIRSRVRSSSDGAPEVLFDLLGEIEPQFQSVVKRLDRLQLTLTGEKPTSPGIPESPPVPEGGAAQKRVTRTDATQGPETKIDAAQEPATKTDAAQEPATKTDAAQKPATKTDAAQKPATKTDAAQKPAAKTGAAQEPAAKTDAAQEPPTPTYRRQTQAPVQTVATVAHGLSLESWINDMNENKPPDTTRWRLDRSSPDFLQVVFEKYERAKGNELRRNFEVIFEHEHGIDRGALTREFFYICFESTMQPKFKDVTMMVGEKGHILPEATAEYLVHAYECLGKMIAHAVRLGCHGFPGLSPAVQTYLVYGKGIAHIEDISPPVSIDDVAEDDLHEVLTKLNDAESLTPHDRDVLAQWMDRSDCRIQLKDTTRYLIIQHLLIYYVFKRRIRQLDAIAAGMQTFDLRDFLEKNPTRDNFDIVFPSPSAIVITPELFKAAVITRGEDFDFTTWGFFERFLDDLASGSIEDRNVSHLVKFLSGSPYLPHQVVVSFSSKDVVPIAHACYNELQLPRNNPDYEKFRENMILGMSHEVYTLEKEPEASTEEQ